MESRPHPPMSAESRGGFPWIFPLLGWAGWVFFRYFSFPSHPLLKVLPFLKDLFDAGQGGSLAASEFWRIQTESLRILGTSVLILGVTWVLGRRVRQWLALDLSDSWVRFGFDFGMGVLCLNLLWIGTGLTGLWYRPLGVAAGVLLLILLFVDLAGFLKARGNWGIQGRPQGGVLLLLAAGCFYFLFSLLQNLAPETFYDSMVYHLAVPSYWLLHHGLADFPTNFFSNYPFGAETYFLNGLVLQGTESAKMLHVICFGVCALLAGGWARELAGPLAGWMTLGLTLTFPLAAVNVWTTQVEGFLGLAVVLLAYSLERWGREERPDGRWALMSGLWAGLSLSTKYTALLVLAVAFVVLAFQRPAFFKKTPWVLWAGMGSGVLLLLGPWVLKNLAFTGNPFFPYAMTHFPGRHLPAAGYERLLQEQHARVTAGLGSWILLPWNLTMSNPDSYNFCGPFSLALAPFLLLFRLRHPALRFLAWLVPLLFLGGFAVTHILRFAFPGFLLLFVLAGAVLGGGEKPAWGKAWAWAAGLSAVLCFPYLAAINHYYYSCAGIWAGRETREEYLLGPGKITPYYSMARWVSNNLPPEAGILIVGDARGIYYERPFLTNSVFDEQVLAKLAREENGAEGIAKRLKEMGVDYLAVNEAEGIRVSAGYGHYDLTSEEWKKLDDFVQNYTQGVYANDVEEGQDVFRVLSSPQASVSPLKDSLFLSFSRPVSKLIGDFNHRQWNDVEGDFNEITKLYPFSEYWKGQKAAFEKQAAAVLKK